MAKFTAGAAVPSLDWDFTAFQPVTDPPSPPWVGRMPEPSQAQIEAFTAAVAAIAPDGDATRLGELTNLADVMGPLVQAIAGVTSGSPSAEQLAAIPFRPLVAFIGFLVGQLGNPT